MIQVEYELYNWQYIDYRVIKKLAITTAELSISVDETPKVLTRKFL